MLDKLIDKIYCMALSRKCRRLNGFFDQRFSGHSNLDDQTAIKSNMVLDFMPVYFNYHKKTWMIKFWKGQYGISTGAEAGIYHADSIIPPLLRPQTTFHPADEGEMFPVTLCLRKNDIPLFTVSHTHWHVCGFMLGRFTAPEELALEISIVFPDYEMNTSFIRALASLGYKNTEIASGQTTAAFCFSAPKNHSSQVYGIWRRRLVILKNYLCCHLFHTLQNLKKKNDTKKFTPKED